MNLKVRTIEVFFMFLVILSFASTGILIMMGQYDYSMILLVVTSILVLTEFYLVLSGSVGRVVDLSRRGRQEGKYGAQSVGNLYGVQYNDLDELGDLGEIGGETVGNMRVYKRGEKIDYVDSNDK